MRALREIRKAKRLTVRECAEAIGVSHQTWTRYEGLKSEPDWDTAGKIAKLLGVTLDQLAGRAPHPHHDPAA